MKSGPRNRPISPRHEQIMAADKSRLAVRTVVLRERLLAVLGAADRPLTTSEILVGLADGGRQCDSRIAVRDGCAHGWRNRYGPTCAGGCWHPRAYPQLRALERLGLISHVPRTDQSSSAHWWVNDSSNGNNDLDLAKTLGSCVAPGQFAPDPRRRRSESGVRAASPRIVRVRRALLAVLNDADGALSTDDVRQGLPPGISYTAAYSQLRVLAELGLVHHKPRFAPPMTRSAMWSSVTDADCDEAINAALARAEEAV